MPFFQSSASADPAPSLSLPPFSLMSPQPRPHPQPAQTAWETDLGLTDIANALVLDRRHRSFVRGVLTALERDEDVIRWRQAVLADFITHPQLTDAIEALLPEMASLGQDTAMLGRRTRSLILQTSDRLSELDLYSELIGKLHSALAGVDLQSDALLKLREHLAAVLANPEYERLRRELPALREPLQNIGSITVAINLDLNLKPISAVLLAINSREAGDPPSLLSRLISFEDDEERDLRGLAAAHRFPRDGNQRRYDPLFQDMNKLMEQTAKPVAQSLKQYIKTSSRTMVTLEPELAFFIGAARMVERLRVQGLPVCQPEILPIEQRTTHINDLHNAQLALMDDDAPPVPSDVQFDDTGRVGVLTGPNSGGKTTYLRSVGMAQVMFQAGLFIPAAAAQISPVTEILTHFPRLETRQQGRLEEEAERLRHLFERITPNSLVLLNETFSSTAFGEALYLAQDILSAMCAVGVRAIFATHIVELIEQFEDIEGAVTVQSNLCSLVAGIRLNADGNPRPTYRVTRGEPLGRSYAQEIARKYGISLEQILAAQSRES